MLANGKVQLRVNELREKAAEKVVLNEAWVLERLMKNVRIAMGEELVTVVVSSTDKATGAIRTVEVQETARDAAETQPARLRSTTYLLQVSSLEVLSFWNEIAFRTGLPAR